MNDYESAKAAVIAFLNSDDRVCLLNGTHQNKKHPLALMGILSHFENSGGAVLFRVNATEHISMFLASAGINSVPKKNKPLKIGGSFLFADTINRASWKSSPNDIVGAVVYPIDSLKRGNGEECVNDLMNRGAQKIILTTWTDNKPFDWTDQYNPVVVTYDAEAERPEYHAEMKTIEAAGLGVTSKLSGLPDYAQSTDPKYLVEIHCRKCNHGRWARLNKPHPGNEPLRSDNGDGGYTATCLKCGEVATDNYNWYARKV